ncbi:MAG: hypothetical protein OXG61_00550 [Chloroflexi bacterium]|nr:hypothetical protein [Chloroflexota bacterium]
MAYYVDVFSPETYERFLASDRTVAGFDGSSRTSNAAQRVRIGDKFLCYITKVQRWGAVLEVVGDYFRDDVPIFSDRDDPYTNRFPVRPALVLRVEEALPIQDAEVWGKLSFIREHERGSSTWTAKIRNSLNPLDDSDGQLLEGLLHRRAPAREASASALEGGRPLAAPSSSVDTDGSGKQDEPKVPSGPDSESSPVREERESIRVQASIAEIGSRMGLDVWVPPSDRGRVEQHLGDGVPLLDRLPLSYNEVTNKTIEQIDVLWLRGRSIVRAFEVEHTTAVYSGLLRMADLLALQPNMEIRLHIVAPSERRSKVLQEIRRPVFERLEGRPLAARCTYISYEKLQDLHRIPHLAHLSDTVLSEYEERAQ